jgi:DNA topoisomerase-1
VARKSATEKPLVIVESPAKARTIAKFLGSDYLVEASIGHVRDLPKGRKEVPEQFKKEEWAYLGIDVTQDFNPIYIVPDQKKDQVQKLKALMKDASELYLATDEDREGEAISWHLCELLKPQVPVKRLVFHEITERALQDALASPRDIDQQLVQAQETRRIVDRLFGYDVSPLLWRKFGRPGLSAGRVQSVAVRLIVDRERERIAFKPASYWDLATTFAAGDAAFPARLAALGAKRLAGSKDFDPKTGKLESGADLVLLDERRAVELARSFEGKTFRVGKVEEKPYSVSPAPPFTTSTLQQEAHRKLRFTAKRTMQVAQSLYENGHITYMRTDSTNLAEVAVEAARNLVQREYGKDFLPAGPRTYKSKVKNAQEAHEAIRPSGDMPLPAQLAGTLNEDQLKLYELIWKRTIACQMVDSKERRISVTLDGPEGGGDAHLTAGGKTIDFAGFKRAYVEGSDDPDAELESQETLLPPLKVGDQVGCQTAEAKGHTTQPPGRFSEATLTRTLEQLGIGRPSTYASIIETILNREYVFKKGTALVPTWTALAVINLLETSLPEMVDYRFTARMEDDLDAISRGEVGHVAYLHSFYFGDEHPGLKKQIATQIDEVDPRKAGRIVLGKGDDGLEIAVRLGKFGPYVEHGERTASLPADLPPDELTAERAAAILDQAQKFEEPIGSDPTTSKPIFVRNGRFGPYMQLGEAGGEEKPKYASLLKGMSLGDVTLEVALKLLSLPRPLGKNPTNGDEVLAANGRYGAYVKCGSENRSIPEGSDPINITLDEALALLAQPKQFRRGFGAPKEPLKVFPVSPTNAREIKVMQGKYGPYVSDGETNASLPKGAEPADLTVEDALKLIEARIASGKGGKKKKKKAAAKKTAPAAEGEAAEKKKSAKKKAAAPKADDAEGGGKKAKKVVKAPKAASKTAASKKKSLKKSAGAEA